MGGSVTRALGGVRMMHLAKAAVLTSVRALEKTGVGLPKCEPYLAHGGFRTAALGAALRASALLQIGAGTYFVRVELPNPAKDESLLLSPPAVPHVARAGSNRA